MNQPIREPSGNETPLSPSELKILRRLLQRGEC